ncbi:MAG: hypothetical protein WBI04_10060 [Trichlorobacter sp.]|jgi:hypothetical protein
MPDNQTMIEFDHEDFEFETLEDELRVDGLCRQLLHQFYNHLQNIDLTPQRASELAFSVDYFVRDYLLDFLQQNVLRPLPGQLRYFAASWYITRTLEPELVVLERHLDGIIAWYRFLRERHLISTDELAMLELEADQREYYRGRIERFLALAGKGYEEWDHECTLRAAATVSS